MTHVLARLAAPFALAATFALAGCGSSPAMQPGAVAAEHAAVESDHDAPGFPTAQALASLGLRPEQQQRVDAIRTTLTSQTQAAHDARRTYAEAIADGVAAGAVDRARVDAAIQNAAAAADAARPAIQQAMNDLHAALDPPQREALVRSMREHWHHAAAGPEAFGPQKRMKQLAEDLGLTSEQKQAFKEQFKGEMRGARHEGREKASAMRDHMKAIGDAFTSPTFDARTLDVGKNNAETTRTFMARGAKLAEAAAKILTPDQRTTLAAKIRERSGRVTP